MEVTEKYREFRKLRKKHWCGNRCDPLRSASKKANQPGSQLASKHCEQKPAEKATARPLCIHRYLDARWLKSQPDLLLQARAGSLNDRLLVGTSRPETKLSKARESIKTHNLPQTLKIEIYKAQHHFCFLLYFCNFRYHFQLYLTVNLCLCRPLLWRFARILANMSLFGVGLLEVFFFFFEVPLLVYIGNFIWTQILMFWRAIFQSGLMCPTAK